MKIEKASINRSLPRSLLPPLPVPQPAQSQIELPLSTVEIAADGHYCVVFAEHAAVMVIKVVVANPELLWDGWDIGVEPTKCMFDLAKEVLGAAAVDQRRGRDYVDWIYPVVLITGAQESLEVRMKDFVEIDSKNRLLFSARWDVTLMCGPRGSDELTLRLNNLLNVLVVRCASWQMLSSYGRDAVDLVNNGALTKKQATAELQKIQRNAARLMIAYHIPLWTSLGVSVKMFDAVDRAWSSSEFAERTRDIIDHVVSALETELSVARERHERKISSAAMALAVLTCFSAMADISTVFGNLNWSVSRWVPISIPIMVVIGIFYGLYRVGSRAERGNVTNVKARQDLASTNPASGAGARQS